ncbi:hypothetical protein U6G28_06460 [Actinomycetaceae bacterium MB13-C1-2]|nr:hypothetical protein U6G28_06460 [Actinomycetaceae bacterium MB13-C1-2]
MSTNDVPATGSWVGVVFFQGEDADRVLDYINKHGTQGAVEYLSNWDYGDETTNAATANGEIHLDISGGMLDHTVEHGSYVLSHNPHLGHVALYRRIDPTPETTAFAVPELEPTPEQDRTSGRSVRDASWYQQSRRPDTASSPARGLGL